MPLWSIPGPGTVAHLEREVHDCPLLAAILDIIQRKNVAQAKCLKKIKTTLWRALFLKVWFKKRCFTKKHTLGQHLVLQKLLNISGKIKTNHIPWHFISLGLKTDKKRRCLQFNTRRGRISNLKGSFRNLHLFLQSEDFNSFNSKRIKGQE